MPLKLPVVIGCDTISVTYTLVGEEPVTVEVDELDSEYLTDEFAIRKVGNEWLVQSDELCSNCINVVFTYLGIDYSFILDVYGTDNYMNYLHDFPRLKLSDGTNTVG